MSVIVNELTIAATPKRVWAALTSPEEITRWWASEAPVTPEVGARVELCFQPPAGSLQFEVAEVDPGKRMRWTTRQGPPHWAGTSVTWQLTPIQSGTRLLFMHEGFAQTDAAYEQTRGNWDYFLDSLKSYLETGKGTPGLPRFV